jgi:6-phosphofructokinase 2
VTQFAVHTLTLNPSIDLSSDTDKVRPTHKVRTTNERMDPGGGGINVARVLHRFGIAVEATYLAGGATGRVLDDLLEKQGLARKAIWIADDTRMSHTVHECSTGDEYRFTPEGPEVAQDELEAVLTSLQIGACEFLVASGSLPRGMPEDVYARVLGQVREHGGRLILDTSGPALRHALRAGGIELIKPSRGELEQLSGRELASREELVGEARRIVDAGQAAHVAVTLGRDGALLVGAEGAHFLPSLPIKSRSAVGAGDAFVAGMTYGLVSGASMLDAFRIATAAGAATALTPGTDLCHPEDVRRLLEEVPEPEPVG